jgi:hypothetical protein
MVRYVASQFIFSAAFRPNDECEVRAVAVEFVPDNFDKNKNAPVLQM